MEEIAARFRQSLQTSLDVTHMLTSSCNSPVDALLFAMNGVLRDIVATGVASSLEHLFGTADKMHVHLTANTSEIAFANFGKSLAVVMQTLMEERGKGGVENSIFTVAQWGSKQYSGFQPSVAPSPFQNTNMTRNSRRIVLTDGNFMVRDIPVKAKRWKIRNLLEEAGTVDEFRMPMDALTQLNYGFAHCKFADETSIEKARELARARLIHGGTISIDTFKWESSYDRSRREEKEDGVNREKESNEAIPYENYKKNRVKYVWKVSPEEYIAPPDSDEDFVEESNNYSSGDACEVKVEEYTVPSDSDDILEVKTEEESYIAPPDSDDEIADANDKDITEDACEVKTEEYTVPPDSEDMDKVKTEEESRIAPPDSDNDIAEENNKNGTEDACEVKTEEYTVPPDSDDMGKVKTEEESYTAPPDSDDDVTTSIPVQSKVRYPKFEQAVKEKKKEAMELNTDEANPSNNEEKEDSDDNVGIE